MSPLSVPAPNSPLDSGDKVPLCASRDGCQKEMTSSHSGIMAEPPPKKFGIPSPEDNLVPLSASMTAKDERLSSRDYLPVPTWVLEEWQSRTDDFLAAYLVSAKRSSVWGHYTFELKALDIRKVLPQPPWRILVVDMVMHTDTCSMQGLGCVPALSVALTGSHQPTGYVSPGSNYAATTRQPYNVPQTPSGRPPWSASPLARSPLPVEVLAVAPLLPNGITTSIPTGQGTEQQLVRPPKAAPGHRTNRRSRRNPNPGPDNQRRGRRPRPDQTRDKDRTGLRPNQAQRPSAIRHSSLRSTDSASKT
jgi:hypothetical protein